MHFVMMSSTGVKEAVIVTKFTSSFLVDEGITLLLLNSLELRGLEVLDEREVESSLSY
jgi:hypothetical protein